MSLDDLNTYDERYIPPEQEPAVAEPVPLPLIHLAQLATPPGMEPAATIGMSPEPVEIAQGPVEPYELLANRGSNLNAHNLNSTFADRLSRGIQAAESATGERAVLRDLYRPPERQAQYYANYTQRPITFGGHTYNPESQGGLAAPPGGSRHQIGEAADVQRGAVLDYLHKNADKFGLTFLKGASYALDPGHVQLPGGGSGDRSNLPASVSMDATTRQLEGRQPLRLTVTPSATNVEPHDADVLESLPPEPEAEPTPVEPEPTDDSKLDELLNQLQALRQPVPSAPIPVTPVPVTQAPQLQPVLTQTPLTVTGADGGLQTISAQDAAIDPTAGMNQGTMLSPETQNAIQSGNVPAYGSDAASSMTHGPAGPSSYIQPQGFAERAAVAVAGIPYAIAKQPVNMFQGMRQRFQDQMQTVPGQMEVNPENTLQDLMTGVGMTGVRAPFVKPGELGATGGKLSATGPRPVPTAQPITPQRFTVADFARTADDQNAGLLRYARRIGLQPQAYDNLRDSFRVTTGATSQTLADSAATLGRAEAPNFLFQVRTPLPEIKTWAADHPGFNDYLNTFDTLDEINAKTIANQNQPNPQPGPITVRGLNHQTATANITAFERANPDFVAARDRYRENLNEARRFASDGEYATMTQQVYADRMANNPNEVPWPERETNATNVSGQPVTRADPSDALGREITVQVRRRINNEAVGMYVDEVRQSPGGVNMFRPVAAADITPSVRDRLVTFKRRGTPEHYLAESRTVADLLKMDPYFFPSTMADKVLGGPRRLFQTFTTGAGAPYFAVRDMLRNYVIAQGTIAGANRGLPLTQTLNPFNKVALKPPGLLGIRQTLTGQGFPLGPGTLPYAFTSQVVPKFANHIAQTLDSSSGNFLRRIGGTRLINSLSDTLARTYLRSTFAQTEAMGTHAASYMGQQADRVAAMSRLTQTISQLKSQPGMRDLAAVASGLRNTLVNTHNATQFAFIQRNLGRRPLTELTAEARELTGNSQTAGRYYTPRGKAITYDTRGASLGQRIAAPIANTYMAANELGRISIPWYNMTQQGIKRFGTSYLNNPTEFGTRAWLYYIMPAAMIYYWNTALGKDPEGIPYVDHMVNRRDEYSQSMFHYLGVPGRSVRDGIEFPSFQEGVLAKRLTEAAMNHLYGTNAWTKQQDFMAALVSALDIGVVPPTPPAIQSAFAMAGVSPPQNLASFPFMQQVVPGLGQMTGIGSDIFQKKADPFDQNSSMPSAIEGTLRSVVPSIADIFGQGMAAWSHTPKEMGKIIAAENFMKQSGRRLVEKTDVFRDLANLHAPMTGNSRFTSRMFDREKEIEQLATFYKRYDPETGQRTLARAKPLSQSGFEAASQQAEFPPPTSPGLGQPAPTNPLYDEFMQQLYDRTKHDSFKTGGIGFRSLWDAYRQWSAGVQEMRNIDYGNMVTWKQRMEQKPDVMRFLQNNKVDPGNPYAVRNLYERKRQDVTRVINNNIDAIEYEMSQKYGRPITIKNLDPYNALNFTGQAVPGSGDIPPWVSDVGSP